MKYWKDKRTQDANTKEFGDEEGITCHKQNLNEGE